MELHRDRPARGTAGTRNASRACGIAVVVGLCLAPGVGVAGSIPTDPNALIDIQFGSNEPTTPTTRYTGAGLYRGGAVDEWNLITGPFTRSGVSANGLPLRSASGAPTTATLSYSTPGGFYNAGASGIFAGTPQQDLMTSYLFAETPGTQAARVTVGGLAANGWYRVVAYSAADDRGRGTTFTVDGVSRTATATATPSLRVGASTVTFAAHATASGDIALSMRQAGTGSFPEANLNGLQVVAVPIVAARDLVNVQFGVGSGIEATARYGGPGVVSSTGVDGWNFVTGNASVALRDAAGNATGITLTHSALDYFNLNALGPDAGIFSRTAEEALLTSYAYADSNRVGGPATFTLSGLVAGARYRLILDSVADAVGRTTTFVLDGATAQSTPSGAQVQGLSDSYTQFDFTADSLGDVSFTMAAGSEPPFSFAEADLNGFQLIALPNAVPEPSTLVLWIAALVSLRLARRRRAIAC